MSCTSGAPFTAPLPKAYFTLTPTMLPPASHSRLLRSPSLHALRPLHCLALHACEIIRIAPAPPMHTRSLVTSYSGLVGAQVCAVDGRPAAAAQAIRPEPRDLVPEPLRVPRAGESRAADRPNHQGRGSIQAARHFLRRKSELNALRTTEHAENAAGCDYPVAPQISRCRWCH
jgi:hypothetical protein